MIWQFVSLTQSNVLLVVYLGWVEVLGIVKLAISFLSVNQNYMSYCRCEYFLLWTQPWVVSQSPN